MDDKMNRNAEKNYRMEQFYGFLEFFDSNSKEDIRDQVTYAKFLYEFSTNVNFDSNINDLSSKLFEKHNLPETPREHFIDRIPYLKQSQDIINHLIDNYGLNNKGFFIDKDSLYQRIYGEKKPSHATLKPYKLFIEYRRNKLKKDGEIGGYVKYKEEFDSLRENYIQLLDGDELVKGLDSIVLNVFLRKTPKDYMKKLEEMVNRNLILDHEYKHKLDQILELDMGELNLSETSASLYSFGKNDKSVLRDIQRDIDRLIDSTIEHEGMTKEEAIEEIKGNGLDPKNLLSTIRDIKVLTPQELSFVMVYGNYHSVIKKLDAIKKIDF
jgi:hypothetical protein